MNCELKAGITDVILNANCVRTH